MDSICNDECSRHLSGLQEIYTDFDSWIFKFSKYCYTSSPQHFRTNEGNVDILKTIQQNDKTSSGKYVTISDLLIEGFLFCKYNKNNKSMSDSMKNELNMFFNLIKDGDAFVNFDSVLLKLINDKRKYFQQYTKSKL